MKNKFYTKPILADEIQLESSNRDVVVQWITDTHVVEWYITYLLKRPLEGYDMEDKVQEIYLQILEVPQAKWDDLVEQGRFSVAAYVMGIIHQQCISVKSKIYQKYGRHNKYFKLMDEEFWKNNENEYEED